MGLAEAVLVGTLGNLAGSLIEYWLGLRVARPALLKLGKYLMIGERDLEAAEEFFRRRGALAVFLGRFVPGVRSLMGFPAGMARMNRPFSPPPPSRGACLGTRLSRARATRSARGGARCCATRATWI